MHKTAKIEVSAMLNCFPQSHKTNFDAMLRGYEMACGELQPGAVIETARQFVKGKIPGQSSDFAPTPAAFAAAVERINSQFNGLERKTAEEQRTRYLESLVRTNRIAHQTEKTPESKARVAALVKRNGAMGSGVPNFNTGTVEERQAKAEKYNQDRAKDKAIWARKVTERKGRG